jgi:putative flavoprotein involved in K+ transport
MSSVVVSSFAIVGVQSLQHPFDPIIGRSKLLYSSNSHRQLNFGNAAGRSSLLLLQHQSCYNHDSNPLFHNQMIDRYNVRTWSMRGTASALEENTMDHLYIPKEEEEDAKMIATKWLQKIQSILYHPNVDDFIVTKELVSQLFVSGTLTKIPFWRDMVAFTWNIITLEGTQQITEFLQNGYTNNCHGFRTYDWILDMNQEIIYDGTENIEFWSTFQTEAGTGRAHVRLVLIHDDDDDHDHQNQKCWKAHTLLTTLQSLHVRPWTTAPLNRPVGIQPGVVPNRIYWHDEQQQPSAPSSPYVVIIGAGQGGLSLAARLQHLGTPYVVYEAGNTPGTSWNNRYPSLHLHDPAYYNHMPYIPFPNTWPIFCPRNKIATWMESYAHILDLNVQCNTLVLRAVQDELTLLWKVDIEQHDPFDTRIIHRSTIECHHVVFATGNSSHPRRPSIPGRYSGIELHSSQYRGGLAYKSNKIRHVVVIGSNNSAFDICQDLWEQLSVRNGGTVESITMIQRSPAMVVSTKSVLQHGLGPLYSENAKLHHEEADIVATTVPYKLAMEKWHSVTMLMQQTDSKMLRDLTEAGYRLDTGPNGTGIFAKSATEGGGFYIDNGCAELVTRGDVSVRYAIVDRFDDSNVVVKHIDDDGSQERLPADMIVYATGFGTMDQWVAKICGRKVANEVGRTWGLGLGHKSKDPGPWEGELRNMWKPVAINGLWFQGGNLAQNRHYSRFLALQLAARYNGIETNVYGIPKPTPPTLTEIIQESSV